MSNKVEQIPVEALSAVKRGNRLGKTDIEELMADIKKNGIREPLQLTYSQSDRTVVLDEGNHRLEAARRLGLKEVPVTVFRIRGPLNGTPVKGIDPVDDYVPGQMAPSQIHFLFKRR